MNFVYFMTRQHTKLWIPYTHVLCWRPRDRPVRHLCAGEAFDF